MIRPRDNADGTPSRPTRPRPPPPPDRHWSLGVTLYHLLTLRMPFADDADVLDPKAGPRGPREHVPHLPRDARGGRAQGPREAPGGPLRDRRRFRRGSPAPARGNPDRSGGAGFLERTVMWARRRPAAAFAAGMTTAFAIVSLLGAGQAVRVGARPRRYGQGPRRGPHC